MASQLTATYAGGVFTPDETVDLPENMRVILRIEPVNGGPLPGSPEAVENFVRHVQQLKFRSGQPRPMRDELYEGR